MRQQHQKSRSRGRGRKPQNPMSRNYESNGPDVKIRGNPSHIAEKYSTLARDALSNGDRVIAENYLQHAEHYNRIVAAAQAQQAQQRQERQDNDRSENEAETSEVEEKAQEEQSSAEGAEESKPNGRSKGKSNGSAGEDPVAAEATTDEATSPETAEGENDKPKRKSTRTRRPRKSAESKAETSDVSEEGADVSVEVISDDAAKLPDSITGGLVAEDG